MRLSKREQDKIYNSLVTAYPSSYRRRLGGLYKGIGGKFSTRPLSDDELVGAIKQLSESIENQVGSIREILAGLRRERRICKGCGEPYGAVRKNQKYCHKRCSARIYQRAYRIRNKKG